MAKQPSNQGVASSSSFTEPTPHPHPQRTCDGCPSIGAIPRGQQMPLPRHKPRWNRHTPRLWWSQILSMTLLKPLHPSFSTVTSTFPQSAETARTARRRRHRQTRHRAWCSSSGRGCWPRELVTTVVDDKRRHVLRGHLLVEARLQFSVSSSPPCFHVIGSWSLTILTAL
jgi:hypothetical protein